MLASWARTNTGWNIYAPIGMNDDSLLDDYEPNDTPFVT
jgi:hypothetical protein